MVPFQSTLVITITTVKGFVCRWDGGGALLQEAREYTMHGDGEGLYCKNLGNTLCMGRGSIART